ncbi:MAG: DUF2974 domain-containing protein [Butyrivibrio sp.]|nr:DUF2974 domain-containing protein [Butyrivibrio sp.]
MGNILDYIDWRGDIMTDRSEFNPIDGLILAQIAYVDFDGIVRSGFGTSVKLSKAARKYDRIFAKKDPETLSRLAVNSHAVLMKAAKADRFKDLTLFNYVQRYDKEDSEQFGAVTFSIDSDTCVVAFRGTDDTLAGWEEDFKLCYMTPVGAQIEAERYLRRVCGRVGGKIYICGHSKGGNLAVYSAMMMSGEDKQKIVSVMNYDGPGFLQDIIERDEYRSILPKIESYMPQGSIVGRIMYHEGEYNIVHSTEKGMQQHVALSWEVLGRSFVKDAAFERSSIIFDAACKKWVSEISIEEREQFIHIVFQILKSGDADTVTDFTAKMLTSMNRVIKSYSGLDRTTRKMVRSIIKQMIKLGTQTISESKKEGRSFIGKNPELREQEE